MGGAKGQTAPPIFFTIKFYFNDETKLNFAKL